MTPRAFITGVAGQDGGYLTELLLSKGYEVFGLIGPDPEARERCESRWPSGFTALDGDLTDMSSLQSAVQLAKPDEVYNLAAQSWVGLSWEDALATTEINAMGVLRLLEVVKAACPDARFCQASSADMFGVSDHEMLSETSCIRPRSPYGAAKAYGHFITVNYRESYGMHACSAIMFNHESPRRPLNFVTRKITDGAARIKLGLAQHLELGNMDVARDWGFAGDYVRAMWMMMQAEDADDYIIATGVTHTVRDLCERAFAHVGLDYREYVRPDERFMRPAEIEVLAADVTKARTVLGWEPQVTFDELIGMMVDADMERLAG